MLTNFHQLKRSLPVSVRDTNSILSYNLIHRRFLADQRSASNHYDVLDVDSNASAQDIKSAFYKLSKKHHPDVNPQDADAAKKFTTISNAYDILGDPVKRREYDHQLLINRSVYNPSPMDYYRTNTYAQRARAHRPSSTRATYTSNPYQNMDNPFTNSRNSTFNSSESEQFRQRTGQYRGPAGENNQFEETYRTYYGDFQQDNQSTTDVDEDNADPSNETISRWNLSRVAIYTIYFGLGLVGFFTSVFLEEMHFQQPTVEFQSKFKYASRPVKNRSYRYKSEQS